MMAQRKPRGHVMYSPEDEYGFDKDLAVRLRDYETPRLSYLRRWRLPHVCILLITVLALQWMMFNLDILVWKQ